MKALLILALLIVAAMAVGWLSVRVTDRGADISIDAEKARSDASRAVEQVGDAIREPIDRMQQPASTR